MFRFVWYDNPPIRFVSYSIQVPYVHYLACRSSKYEWIILSISSYAIHLYKRTQFRRTCTSRSVIQPITPKQHTLFKWFSKIFNTNNLLEDSIIIILKSTFLAPFHTNTTTVNLFPYTPFFLCETEIYRLYMQTKMSLFLKAIEPNDICVFGIHHWRFVRFQPAFIFKKFINKQSIL